MNKNVPVAASPTNVIAVAGGGAHTCVVLSTGEVDCVGYNGSGELGNGNYNDSVTFVKAISSGAVAIAAGESQLARSWATAPFTVGEQTSTVSSATAPTTTRTYRSRSGVLIALPVGAGLG